MQRCDVAIIGAGPIGLELAVALKQAQVDYLQFDAGQVGQTMSWYPRQVRFFSSPERIAIAGVPLNTADQGKATREEYLAYLRSIVQMFDLQVRTYERVIGIERQEQEFLLRTQHQGREQAYLAQRVVIAIGDMHRPRKLDVPGEDLPHVAHYFMDPHPYFQQDLLIAGGRNSAVEAAIRCQRAGARVTLSYRGAELDRKAIKYWLLPELQWLIDSGQIKFLPQTRPVQIEPGVTMLEKDAEPPFAVRADFVLLLVGYVMDPALLQMAGVPLDGVNQAPRFDPETMHTPVPGLYVAGTAAAGTQVNFRLFIENCHHHVLKIARAITGRTPAAINPLAFQQAAARRVEEAPES